MPTPWCLPPGRAQVQVRKWIRKHATPSQQSVLSPRNCDPRNVVDDIPGARQFEERQRHDHGHDTSETESTAAGSDHPDSPRHVEEMVHNIRSAQPYGLGPKNISTMARSVPGAVLAAASAPTPSFSSHVAAMRGAPMGAHPMGMSAPMGAHPMGAHRDRLAMFVTVQNL
jgi:hypothetical protein